MRLVHNDVATWMREAGMSVRIDHTGNIIGNRPASDGDAKTLLIGSHLDTVPDAGRFDGIVGVLVGIAVVEAMRSIELPFAIDVIGFSEEEGVRFATPYLGSAAIAGRFDPAWLDLIDTQGLSMRSAIEAFGLSPIRIGDAAYSPDRVLGFVEAHIEQGPVLASEGLPIATVSAIAGQSRFRLLFRGRPGHAGTTPMTPRPMRWWWRLDSLPRFPNSETHVRGCVRRSA